MSIKVAPSILSADFANIQSEVEMLNESEADWIHVDIMDGVFVPNLSFGIPVTAAIHKHAKKPLDVHLMIVKPENYVPQFIRAGAQFISVHYEACDHLHRNIQQIKTEGARAGVALNPHTPVYLLREIINDLDLVCIMSVNPGFGGQKFIENACNKIKDLKELRESKNAEFLIEVDGGVNDETAPLLKNSGADVLVAGSHVFKSNDPRHTIQSLKNV
jgi:ribulose-phosphate 3-epimerase